MDRKQNAQTMPLFVYGSLMYQRVLRALLGRVPEQQEAIAYGWERREFPGHTYPVLVKKENTLTRGILLTDLTIGEQYLLEVFENRIYRRAEILVYHNGIPENAFAYVVDAVENFPDPYSFEMFEKQLDWFVSSCERFRGEHLDVATLVS